MDLDSESSRSDSTDRGESGPKTDLPSDARSGARLAWRWESGGSPLCCPSARATPVLSTGVVTVTIEGTIGGNYIDSYHDGNIPVGKVYMVTT